MTKEAALYNFFSGFGMDAYAASSVPEDVTFPWLTYEVAIGAWGDGQVGLTVNLWFYTTSEAIPNAKTQELSEAIGYGGKVIPCDGGYIWLTRGSPWCQPLTDDTDKTIKRRYINVNAEYLTLN